MRQALQVSDEMVGRKGKRNSCGAVLLIPELPGTYVVFGRIAQTSAEWRVKTHFRLKHDL
jgi:hypothetical protein